MKEWSVAKQWNESISQNRKAWVAQERTSLWASELGKSDIDIYLKMKGIESSNHPNDRALRKMDGGIIWEWAIKQILIKTGLYKPVSQMSVSFKDEGLCEVRGKLDFIAGGEFNYSESLKYIEEMILPEVMLDGIRGILSQFKDDVIFREKVLEFKSVSSFAFDKIERTQKALAGHELQLFHYVYNLKKEGSIVYFCRDDARMYEIPIMPNDERLLKIYLDKIKRVSDFYLKDEKPPLESPILFDEDLGKFSKNFNVQYSSYLTLNYNLKDQTEYEDKYSPIVERFNRVLARISAGKDMTEKNKLALDEMQSLGYNVEKIIEIAKSKMQPNENILDEEVAN